MGKKEESWVTGPVLIIITRPKNTEVGFGQTDQLY